MWNRLTLHGGGCAGKCDEESAAIEGQRVFEEARCSDYLHTSRWMIGFGEVEGGLGKVVL